MMRAIRCQKHHRKHTEPCQVFPFCVKLQSRKCWKHCSYWVLSEVPIFQRDPPVPIEIHGAAYGKTVGMLVWIKCEFSQKWFSALPLVTGSFIWMGPAEMLVWQSCISLGSGLLWSAKAPGVIQGTLSGLSTVSSQPGNYCLQLRTAVGEKGMNNLFVSTAPCSITLLFLYLLEFFSAQQCRITAVLD